MEILERTPATLSALLTGIDAAWTTSNEGGETWSVFDIVGHLIHGEKSDWLPRTEIILSNAADKSFTPFDRFAQFTDSKGKTLGQLLNEFAERRKANLDKLRSLAIKQEDLAKTGIHPAFGEVSLSELLATWVVHDLNHIAQIARVMAKQYKEETGPWLAYLKILKIE